MARRHRAALGGGIAALVALVLLSTWLVVRDDPQQDGQTKAEPAPSPAVSPSEPASLPVDDGAFRPLAVGAGGFVTGISFSEDGRTRVIRTDTSGGYRWAEDKWQLDVSSQSLPADDVAPGSGDGVLAVEVAPSDASRVYMAYSDGIFRSDDAGKSWSRVLSDVSTAPNDDFRTWGSRLAVDPVDPDVVYYGSQLDGMYLSRDAGKSWTQVETSVLPAGELVDLSDEAERGDVSRPTNLDAKGEARLAGAGLSAVVIDPSASPSSSLARVVYAASYGRGVYRSTNSGDSWTKVSPPGVRAVAHLRVLSNGDVLVTSHADPTDLKGPADVWRLRDDSWSQLTLPTEDNWRGIAEDQSTPGVVAAIAPGGRLALSNDFGDTWSELSRTETSEGDVPWLAWALNGGTDYMSVGEIAFDPVKAGRLWFTEGTGVWFADLAAADSTVRWRSQSRGIEQLVPTGVIAPPGGKPVLTAWDRAIFRSEGPETYPTHYGPVNEFSSAWSSDWSVSDPDYLVASVASHQWPHDPSDSGFSTDGGKTWQAFPSVPMDSGNALMTFGFGSVAVGEPGNVVWVPSYGKRPHFTLDGGRTWDPIKLPGVTDYSAIGKTPYFVNRQVLAADKTAPGTFYLYVLGAGVFSTADGGETWTQRADDTAFAGVDMAWGVSLKAVPEEPGELFMTPGRLSDVTNQPFKHSTDGGETWSDVPGVTGVTAFGFGKTFGGSDEATVFLAGYLRGRYGVYRSTDGARSWKLLTDYPAGRTATIIGIDGDKNIAGQVYMGIAGAGWVYGQRSASVTGRGAPR